MSKTERREIHYHGRVQGVGFRYTTREIAQRFQVAGYVENLLDGSVHLVVEGEPDELDRFLAAVAQRLERYIAEVDDRKQTPTGEFDDLFTIRR
jgi:acylphosphatase